MFFAISTEVMTCELRMLTRLLDGCMDGLKEVKLPMT